MKLTLFLLLISFHLISWGQIADNTQRHDEKNIYYQALARYVQFSTKELKNGTSDTIIVYKDNKTTDSLLEQIGSTEIIMVEDPYDYIKKHKRHPIALYSIFPLEYNNNEFSVSFVPFSAHINTKNHQLYLENPGSIKVVFKFENNHFTFVRIEDHGI